MNVLRKWNLKFKQRKQTIIKKKYTVKTKFKI